MKRASGICGTITEMPTFVTSGVSKEEEKERTMISSSNLALDVIYM